MDEKKDEKREVIAPEKKKKIKQLVCLVLLVLVVAGCCAGYYFISVRANYFTTDNAKVTAKMYNVLPAASGKLLEWDVESGDLVSKNQVLGRQETLPYITSPITGTVVKNEASVDQAVSPGSPLAVIADTDNMYIGVNVEETEIARIKLGQVVDVTIDAYPGKTFRGRVTDIDLTTQTFFSNASSFSTSGTFTKVTQLIPVKVTLLDTQSLPMAFGMNATVKIHLK